MSMFRTQEENRSLETAARQRVSDDGATSSFSSDRQSAHIYRQCAKRFGLAIGLLLVAAVALFAFGRIAYAVVACWGSILNAAVVVYLIRAARRLDRDS